MERTSPFLGRRQSPVALRGSTCAGVQVRGWGRGEPARGLSPGRGAPCTASSSSWAAAPGSSLGTGTEPRAPLLSTLMRVDRHAPGTPSDVGVRAPGPTQEALEPSDAPAPALPHTQAHAEVLAPRSSALLPDGRGHARPECRDVGASPSARGDPLQVQQTHPLGAFRHLFLPSSGAEGERGRHGNRRTRPLRSPEPSVRDAVPPPQSRGAREMQRQDTQTTEAHASGGPRLPRTPFAERGRPPALGGPSWCGRAHALRPCGGKLPAAPGASGGASDRRGRGISALYLRTNKMHACIPPLTRGQMSRLIHSSSYWSCFHF